MQFASIFKALGFIVLILALSLLIPVVYAFVFNEPHKIELLYSFCVSLFSGGLLALIPKSKKPFKYKDGFLLVSLGWLSAGFFGCLPFYITQSIPSFTNAYFESISGFTTTGASILTDIESMPESLLLWRSMTQWFGGMGIIVLSLAILPYLDFGGMSLFQAEVPGPTAEKLTPRIQDTAKVLWMVYFVLTFILIILLFSAGMSVFDSVNHAFTTMSTGGFSTKNTSVAAFASPAVEWIITVFMFLAGINFALHFRFLFKGFNLKHYLEDSEVSFYFWVTTLCVFSITAVLYFSADASGGRIFRDASFMVVSILTTTGFGTTDYELWPIYCQFVLLFAMVLGGCAGSTSGGIKSVRAMLVLKYMYSELIKLLHPSMVRTVKLGKTVVDRSVLANILGFIFIYSFVMATSILIVSLETDDMVTAIGSVVASLGNIGPGFGTVGPTENYAHLGDFTKWVLGLDMVMGRLEIFTILVLFLPQTWRK